MLKSRTGVMLLGPPQCGKSALLQGLVHALPAISSAPTAGSLCGRPIKDVRIFVKAVPPAELYGRWDPVASDWLDGVFARHWRRAGMTHAPQQSGDGVDGHEAYEKHDTSQPREATWMVLDGPVEPTWVENLNSVLDDTGTLTLTNGDRLPVPDGMRVIMETDSLQHASPATISRCGIMAIDAGRMVPWQAQLESWLRQRRLAVSRRLLPLFAAYVARLCRCLGV